MIHITKILVPVDFSDASKKALVYGFIPARFKAKLVAAHIVPESAALAYAFPAEAFAIEGSQLAQATKELRDLLSRDYVTTIETEAITQIGRIDKALLRIVKDHSIDLVVMGTHGRGYAGRWFLGSVTERMLRKVPVPVVTVSRVEDGKHLLKPSLATIKNILYAADAPEPSPALDYAIELAGRSGVKLTILHVVEFLNPLYAGAQITSEAEDRVNQMRHRFDEFLSPLRSQGLPIETIVREGKPYKEILRIAEDRGVDLIVLNMHSKGVLERAFLGSTAERVVRLADTPVLSVPAAIAPNTNATDNHS
jgi:nucleotide-binding universal stress UspA family protein